MNYTENHVYMSVVKKTSVIQSIEIEIICSLQQC